MQPQITYVEGIDAVLYDDDILILCTNIGIFPQLKATKQGTLPEVSSAILSK